MSLREYVSTLFQAAVFLRRYPRFGNGTFLYCFDWYRGIYPAISYNNYYNYN